MQAICQYELGKFKPRPAMVYKLAEALSCSVYDISDLKPQPGDRAFRDQRITYGGDPESLAVEELRESEHDLYGGLLDEALHKYWGHFTKHERPDIIKLLGLWQELNASERRHCLSCMEGLISNKPDSALSA
jgi:hypothetical protein